MRSIIRAANVVFLLLGLSLARGLQQRDDCNQDNCLRDVVATRFGAGQLSIASADCSSFFSGTTVTVITTSGVGGKTSVSTTETVTVTKTAHATKLTTVAVVKTKTATAITTVYDHTKQRRADKVVPSYASDCTASGQYSSACSCFGVLPATVTKIAASEAPKTVTKTVVVTSSADTTVFKTETFKSKTKTTKTVTRATTRVALPV